MKALKIFFLILAGCIATGQADNPLILNIETTRKAIPIPETMYGIFFEDINFGADGGLYAEKIKNRSFEFPNPLQGWTIAGKVEILDDGPFDRNPHYIRLKPSGHDEKHTAIVNEGFFGVSFEKDSTYNFSLYGRVPSGKEAKLEVQLTDEVTSMGNQTAAAQKIYVKGNEWQKYEVSLRPDRTVEKGKLRIYLRHPDETVDLEHISLFPADNWHGLRSDLVERLVELKPGVFRFPGGCIVEGTDLGTRYEWKNSVGTVENRPLNENRWQYTFRHHFFPDYFQTLGLGFYEYFLLSEKLGAAALPVVNVGLSCQYQNHDMSAHVAVDSLQPYIDDALDLIEFANGDPTTEWGSLRASMGHPLPFGLKYLAVGNEQWGPEYVERLAPFVKAIRAKHPEIHIIGSSGPDSEGDKFDYLWPEMTNLKVDLVDEHYYRPDEWFLDNARRYDSYSRKNPKVFAGEYACHTKGHGYNHFGAALAEAAFMTGLERNADVVEMATYAPLFAHVEGWQWRPDMIWFDNLRSMPTASYYVQQLYSQNRGTHALKTSGADGLPLAGENGLYATVARDDNAGDYIVKVANVSDSDRQLALNFNGLKKRIKVESCKTLHAGELDENTLDNPGIVAPAVCDVEASAGPKQAMELTIPARSFQVYRIK